MQSYISSLQGSVSKELRKRYLRAIYKKSLKDFVQAAWKVIEPSTPLIWGWHMDAICLHLEALTKRKIKNLIIQVPPRSSKSTLCSVIWPVWVWLHNPGARFLTASYSVDLATRDAVRSRRILNSPWFKELYANEIVLSSDQNIKSRYENTSTGYRLATAVNASATGEGGDYTVIDDPHDANKVVSDTERLMALRWHDEAFYNRINNMSLGGRLIIGQRVHDNDLIGYLKEKQDPNWVELMIPEEYEPERRCKTSIGWEDPRIFEGELLRPDRLDMYEIERLKIDIGDYAYSAQYQQNPIHRRGGMFSETNFTQFVKAVPSNCSFVRYWDKAGTEGSGAYTVGVLMARSAGGIYYVVDVVRGQWAAAEREAIIKLTAQMDLDTYGYVTTWMEQEPGSSGKDIAELSIRNMDGFSVFAEKPVGNKVARAQGFAAQVQINNVILVEASWNRPYIHELSRFPVGKYKDQVDASSGAFMKLALGASIGWDAESALSESHSIFSKLPSGVMTHEVDEWGNSLGLEILNGNVYEDRGNEDIDSEEYDLPDFMNMQF